MESHGLVRIIQAMTAAASVTSTSGYNYKLELVSTQLTQWHLELPILGSTALGWLLMFAILYVVTIMLLVFMQCNSVK